MIAAHIQGSVVALEVSMQPPRVSVRLSNPLPRLPVVVEAMKLRKVVVLRACRPRNEYWVKVNKLLMKRTPTVVRINPIPGHVTAGVQSEEFDFVGEGLSASLIQPSNFKNNK